MASSIARRLVGIKAKAVGASFENMLKVPASMMGAALIRMPDGCETYRRGDAIATKRVRTPFDFILARKGQPCAFFDAKTVAGKTFAFSDVKPHQIEALYALKRQGMCAGYVVWFRGIDRVVWFDVQLLMSLRRGMSLKPEEGLLIGGAIRMDLSVIFARPYPVGAISSQAP